MGGGGFFATAGGALPAFRDPVDLIEEFEEEQLMEDVGKCVFLEDALD